MDIEDHSDGAAIVAQVNNGDLTVPTVLFRDGSALTNPSASAGWQPTALAHPVLVAQEVCWNRRPGSVGLDFIRQPAAEPDY